MKVFRDKSQLIKEIFNSDSVVLDVGFAGQHIKPGSSQYPHEILKRTCRQVCGVDMKLPDGYEGENYICANAESFYFGRTFDAVIGFDLIEHLSNPGMFLDSCAKHSDTLILTTPNAFNLFNLVEKITHREPNVNSDHTCYFNEKTLRVLCKKNGWDVVDVGMMSDMLGDSMDGGIKRKILGLLYKFLALFTDKFMSTLVIFARRV